MPVMTGLDAIAERGLPATQGRAIEAADRQRAVRRAVQTLPPKYRDVVILYYFHEKDVRRRH